MKRFVLLMVITLFLMVGIGTAETRFHIAGASHMITGPDSKESTYNFKTGFSHKLKDIGGGGALYGVALGKYGESGNIKGANLELVFFPVAPTDKGLKLFFPVGTNITQIDNAETYWQFASGVGLYLGLNPGVAIWGACKAESSEKLTTVDIAIGLAIKVF